MMDKNLNIRGDGALRPLPLPTERSSDVDPYQRRCLACAAWLNYRSVGPAGARALYSYCPNSDCEKSGQPVQEVHVS